jgi:hypothetical protein
MNAQSAPFRVLLFVIFLAVSGCSSGGGSSSVGIVLPPPPVSGITRTGAAVSVGPITAFGSVVVNGVRYDTSGTEFTVDGQQATQTDLKVGDMVVVKGTIDDDNTNAVAESIEFEDNVEGPVSSVDSASSTLIVLGQTVLIGDGTSIDDNCPALLADFVTVAAVEVSGQVAADGSILATRIECKSILGEMEVTGVVSNLGTDTFMINSLVVDFTNVPAILDNFASGSISEGDPVEAKGTSIGGTGELVATRVEFKGARFANNEGDHVEIEGFITRFTSDVDFDVDGLPVTTMSGTTVFQGGVAGDLGLNLKVEVEGEFDSAGVLNATKVEFKKAPAVRLVAQVDSVSGSSLVMLGITVNTDARTRFEDKAGSNPLDSFAIVNVNAGDYIEVRGQEFPAGSGDIMAIILERDDIDTRVILQGFVEAGGVNRPTLTVLGVAIETGLGTVFRNDDETVIANPDDFWNRVAEGSLIKAKGAESSSQTIAAEEVELQME